MRCSCRLLSVLLIFLCILLLASCSTRTLESVANTVDQDNNTVETAPNRIETVENETSINLYPSASEKIVITVPNDIDRLVRHLDGIEREEIAIQENIYGWEILVKIGAPISRTVLFVGNLMKDNGVWYQVSCEEISLFRDFCKNLNAFEVP